MPRSRKKPRLWLRPARGPRRATWLILDGQTQVATSAAESEVEKAQALFDVYMRDVYVPQPERQFQETVEARRHFGFVYFISTNDVPGFPIKIGYARSDADMRLRALQTGCPYRLVVLATIRGSRATETRLHGEFAVLRMNGEWFQRSIELMETVSLARQRLSRTDQETIVSFA